MPQGQKPSSMNNTRKNPSNQGDHSDHEKSQSQGKTREHQEGREGGNHTRPSDKDK